MIEIRPIRDHEANPFLELICEIFELDVDRAQGIFFNEPLFDLSRKWALFEGGQMASVLTTVPLKFGWGTAIGIAGVATKLARRRLGLAETLLNHVLKDSEHREERVALLFAKEIGLYEKVWFSRPRPSHSRSLGGRS